MYLNQFLDAVIERVLLDKSWFEKGIIDEEIYQMSYESDALLKRDIEIERPKVFTGVLFDIIYNYGINEFCIRYFSFLEPMYIHINNRKLVIIGNNEALYVVLELESDNVFMLDASGLEIVCKCATSQMNFLNCLTELMKIDLKRRNNIQSNIKENQLLHDNGLNTIKKLSGVDKNDMVKIESFYGDLLP